MTHDADKSESPPSRAEKKRNSEAERILLHMPVDVRSMALVVLAVLASIFALQWARAILVPILLGVMFSYALTPAVDRIARWRVPRALPPARC